MTPKGSPCDSINHIQRSRNFLKVLPVVDGRGCRVNSNRIGNS